jgi:TolB-like protein
MKRLPGDDRDQRFAVMPFSEVGTEAQERQLGLVVTDLIATSLVRDHRLELVERAALAKVLNEQALGQTGVIDETQAASVGKIAGARALVVGQVADAIDNFQVTLRVLDSEDARVLVAQSLSLPKAELMAFSADAVVLRSKSGAMFRSLVAPGWGQAYNDEPTKALVLGGTTATLAVATAATTATALVTYFGVYQAIGSRPEDAGRTPSELKVLTRDTLALANGTLTAAAVVGGLAVVSWGVTVVDAYLSGPDAAGAPGGR